MSLITFLSDFGTTDHYVAAVKASIVSQRPDQIIVDLSHDIRPFDIAHAAHVLSNVYRDFPENTVHLVAVDAMKQKSSPIALELDDHFFVGFDSGLFSLLSHKKPTTISVLHSNGSSFPAKDVLASAALALARGEKIEQIGESADSMVELFQRQLKMTKREIAGNVVAVDHYGNLITNIQKSEFEKILEINGQGTKYSIRLGRELFDQIHGYYTDVESGDCFIIFNSTGTLQIGINKGDASELLGLRIDAPIVIEFATK